jgi:hypothetical protein
MSETTVGADLPGRPTASQLVTGTDLPDAASQGVQADAGGRVDHSQTTAWIDKSLDELIAEFHSVCGVKPGKVTFEDGLIVFRYPLTGLREDRITRPRLQEIIDRRRRHQQF